MMSIGPALLALMLLGGGPSSADTQRSQTFLSDYTYGYWLHGWRKPADDPSPDLLCYQTSRFALALDLAAPDKPRFALFSDGRGYLDGLGAATGRLAGLMPAELRVELETGGKTYRLVGCQAGSAEDERRLEAIRLWESGRWVQHYDVQELIFRDEAGNTLGCRGTLDLVAWPDSLTLTTELAPRPALADGPNEGVLGTGLGVIDKPLDLPHEAALDPETFTVECWVKIPEVLAARGSGWLLCKNNHEEQDGNYGFILQGGAPSATLNIGGGRANRHAVGGRQKLVPDAWNHLALSYDGQTLAFYLNGAAQGTAAVGKPRRPGTGGLRIGKRADNFGAPVQGLYDELRIWNRALSPQEIRRHAGSAQEATDRQGLVWEEDFEPADGRPFEPPVWTDAVLRARFTAGGRNWSGETRVPGPWPMGQPHAVTVNCDLDAPYAARTEISVVVQTPDGPSFPVAFEPMTNCHVARIKGLQRPWKTGMTDVRHYDEFLLTVENAGPEAQTVSLLTELIGTANITGLCPVLCDEQGVPTGLPVQLSKNWHYPAIGDYLRAYLRIPAPPGRQRYLLRVVYGFYGTVPSASHAQLSLVGYGGNGRWDQLAIGCWGETFCLDTDMSLVDVAITDTRCLMVRRGAGGAAWNWTEGGWGGDWLGVYDRQGRKLCFRAMQAAYLAHGPCLSDVRYAGHYGPQGEVELRATVHTLRTDDYARTFHRLRYTFHQPLAAENTWLFKMGRTGGLVTPRIAYGHGAGLLVERDVPVDLKPSEVLLEAATLEGQGPWWVAFPGAVHPDGTMPDGSRALVIRSYAATFGGQTYRQPTVRMPVFAPQNVDLLLVPPREVTAYQPGDSVELDVQWITLPRNADDYYGPNESFRRHLAENPCSWKTTYREARGNDLRLAVEGGTVLSNYPILIRAERPEVRVEIRGGVGYVPIRFEGLATARGWTLRRAEAGKAAPLDQAVHGNDYWQADYDAESRTYRLTFNLPLDGEDRSTWVFQPR